MKKFANVLGFGREFKNGSGVLLNVRNLVDNLEAYEEIRVFTTSEMWRRNTVPDRYRKYVQWKTPHFDMVHFMEWQESKESDIVKALESGVPSNKIDPITAALNVYNHIFSITDGVTRIRVFNKKGIGYIPAILTFENIYGNEYCPPYFRKRL